MIWVVLICVAAVIIAAKISTWSWPQGPNHGDTIFYDGACGLCHRFVRIVVTHDAQGYFRFAPLQGEAMAKAIPDADRRSALPDSIVVVTSANIVLVESDATAYILIGLGGFWRLLGVPLRLVPRPLRNLGYRCVAGVRSRLFKRPDNVCPLVPEELRDRFLS